MGESISMNIYSIAICDDEKATCDSLENMLQGIFDEKALVVEVESFYSGEKLATRLVQGGKFDFLILDIEMFELSGIEVGRIVRDKLKNFQTQIIYVSSKTMYALNLFKVQPLDFLEKPVDFIEMKEAIERGIEILGNGNSFFEFVIKNDTERIAYRDILYFESMGRQVKLVTVFSEYLFYGKLSEIRNRLPDFFAQIHRAYVVNLSSLQKCSYDCVKLKGGIELPISRGYREAVRKQLMRSL